MLSQKAEVNPIETLFASHIAVLLGWTLTGLARIARPIPWPDRCE
jgi:hypothetical protein